MEDQNQNGVKSEVLDALLKTGPKIPKVGDLIEASVISVSKNEAHLDIEGIGTGMARGPEFVDESGEYSNLKPGDRVWATVLELENENGEMELSFREAGHKKAWERLAGYLKKGEIVNARIVDANRGGLMVKIGNIDGFLPVSQLTAQHYPRVEGGDKGKILDKLKSYVNQTFRVKVIDVDENENKLIISERGAWEEAEKEKVSQFKTGDIVEGKVVGVVDFGAFVEFGEHLEGLIHISELSWDRVNHPREILNVGQTVKAQILSVDGTKISLTLKRLSDDPWKNITQKYAIGQKVSGIIIKLNPFGLFVDLKESITALCHISEIPEANPQNISTLAKEGDEREFRIVAIDPEGRRIHLSLKEPAPVEEVKEEKVEQKSEEVKEETLAAPTEPVETKPE